MLVKKLKSKIPTFISFPFWYVFKAPQRKVSRYTLYADIKGILVFLYRHIIPKKPLQPVSICTGIYNRSHNYLNNLLVSLNNIPHRDLVELSVFDCNSNDIENLEAAIRKQWKGKLVFNSEDRPFSRSYTFNKAVAQAGSPIVFICDADLSLPQNIVSLCNNYTGKKTVWYPIYFFLYKNKPVKVAKENGEWEQYGSKGMFACTKKAYENIGGLNEQYTTWGYEDTELWLRFHTQKYTIIRNQQPNFFHHWHTTHNPKYAHLN